MGGRLLFAAGAVALGAWLWGWIGGLVALGIAGLVNRLVWTLEGRPELEPAAAERWVSGVVRVMTGLTALLFGAGAIVVYFILPGALFHHLGLALPVAVTLALVSGSALTAATVVGLRRGWITLGD